LNNLRGYATAEIGDAVFSTGEARFKDQQILLRESIGRRIDSLFPRSAALARAFLLGDRSQLSDEDRRDYNQSGAGHLLAISGMHVSVLAGFIAYLLDRILGRRGSYVLTLAILLIYGTLIGFSASLTRAILMFAIYKLAPLIGRSSDAPSRIAAAMLIYLLLRPIAILEAGFILSYGASAGILLLSAPLSRLMHIDQLLKSKPRNGFIALFTNRLPKYLAQAIVDKHTPDRLLFGSDMPWHRPSWELRLLNSLDMSETDRQKIFHGNAEKLLGL
jgi:ComEC/Rec2-related protein